MSTVFKDINEALMATVKAAAAALSPAALPVSWPDREFDPTAGTSYLRVRLLPIPTIPASGGVNGLNLHQGILELMICSPPGAGSDAPLAYTDQLATVFKRGAALSSGSVRVGVESVSRDTPIHDKAWTLYPINIRWRCYAGD